MTLLKKIKLLWILNKSYNKFKEDLKKMETTNKVKPGWLTTEFWLIVITNLLVVAETFKGCIEPEKMAIILAILNGLYNVLRTLLKQPDITTIISKEDGKL